MLTHYVFHVQHVRPEDKLVGLVNVSRVVRVKGQRTDAPLLLSLWQVSGQFPTL